MLGKKEIKNINLIGEKSVNIEENKGVVNIIQGKSELTDDQILENFNLASVDLSNYTNKFQERVHIPRSETKKLFDWINAELSDSDSNISLLVGNAGCGKSVIMRDLNEQIKNQNIPVLAIKADRILNVNSIKEIEEELSLDDDIISMYKTLLEKYPLCVLLIDQIDALSQSLSSKRQTIDSYDKIINRLSSFKNVRIIISTRTYDLNFDPIIRSYKRHNTINVALLNPEDVDFVLNEFQIEINPDMTNLKEFLRTPLHLNLFCKIGLLEKFEESISRQKLYDELWEKYITAYKEVSDTDSDKLTGALTTIAQHMNEQQHIVVDKRQFQKYANEIFYLLHHELLVETSSNKLQFIHQSFFDYTYARTFVQSGKSITVWLKERHQGLFIRSQVKQVFTYLRDLDPQLYAKELKEIITKTTYRFHLKVLLISDLGFYSEPLILEQKIVEKIILETIYFQLFLESINSLKWFEYILKKEEFKKIIRSKDNEIQNTLMKLCIRLIVQHPEEIINFLENNPISPKIIENTLFYIEDKDVYLSHNLYRKIAKKSDFNLRDDFHYLEKSVKEYPTFVIEELQRQFNENIRGLDSYDDKHIPGEYSALQIYQKLYDAHPNIAIPFFINIIKKIADAKKYDSSYGLVGDLSFYLFRPAPSNKIHRDYKDLYNAVLYSIENNNLNSSSIKIIESLIHSKYANILSIGIYLLLQHTEVYINQVFELFQHNNFFSQRKSSEILEYYVNLLIGKSFPLFTQEQQCIINEIFMNINPKYDLTTWAKRGTGVSKYSYTRHLLTSYTLISMIPTTFRNQYPDIQKRYQEGYRKFQEVKNTPPQKVEVRSGSMSYGSNTYKKMSFVDWRNTFRKLKTEERSFDDWNKPSFDGNKEQFKNAVKESPKHFLPFIHEIINEDDIVTSYPISGIDGLNESNIAKTEIEKVILVLLRKKKDSLSDFESLQLLWILRKICNEYSSNDRLILPETLDFIIDYAMHYKDRTDNLIRVYGQTELTPKDLHGSGINSTRGVAVECLVMCYNMHGYKESIFSTLEYVADNSNNVTRSCIIMYGAYLNTLDKQRAFDLYLRCIADNDPLLLGLPAHEGHPLYYLNYINFKGLIPLYEKAIIIETDEIGKAMSNFLLNAYMNAAPKSYSLLKKLIDQNNAARIKTIQNVSREFKDDKYRAKGWKLLNYMLKFDNEELGKQYDVSFSNFKDEYSPELEKFITNYLKSPISKFRSNFFYELLGNLIHNNSEQCLIWFFDSNPQYIVQEYYHRSPLNILIESYNGIRDYDKENPLLEKAMNTFDSLLLLSEYRNYHLNVVLKELES